MLDEPINTVFALLLTNVIFCGVIEKPELDPENRYDALLAIIDTFDRFNMKLVLHPDILIFVALLLVNNILDGDIVKIELLPTRLILALGAFNITLEGVSIKYMFEPNISMLCKYSPPSDKLELLILRAVLDDAKNTFDGDNDKMLFEPSIITLLAFGAVKSILE